jgi:hypothetical protein
MLKGVMGAIVCFYLKLAGKRMVLDEKLMAMAGALLKKLVVEKCATH